MSTFYLCYSKSLDVQLDELSKSRKQGKLAVMRYQEIIETIRKSGLAGMYRLTKRTKKGEGRIAKCIKYDLGSGYRLITIRWKNHIFIPFAGTHDKADLWLKHNQSEDIHQNNGTYSIEKIATSHVSIESEKIPLLSPYDEYEEKLLHKIDEKTLRQIFVGIVSKTNQDSSTIRWG